ncbi:MAG: hypothetical protein ACD_71C00129G0003 [uncultured bacterium (gcode 4)]|uniref:Uncharacterized protein n=1 Tax=uncultured bacterium (gcode 4) TaxID=1234023 RepID=K1YNA7_9BACT|nr:MAG: hypothetical protein ACD_71C00129G0003 [uncultured bacterium (gcode 4)]
MQKILLFKLGAIGDVLMTTPFVRQLRRGLWEENDITYMVGKRSSEVLVWNPNIDEIIMFDEDIFSKRDIWRWMRLIFRLRKLAKEYETIVVFDKHWILSLTAFLGWFGRRIWFDRMGKEGRLLTDELYYDASKREVEYYLDLLQSFWIKADYNDQKYNIFWWIIDKLNNNEELDLKEKELVSNFLKKKEEIDNFINDLKKKWKKIIWISTGWGNIVTNQIHKNKDCRWWNINNWIALSENLLKSGYQVILLWSKTDRNLDIKNISFHNFLWKNWIIETIYLITKLGLVIWQESWFGHFVWCTNTSLILLAWPTNPQRFFPYNQTWKYIWKEKKECYDCYGSYKNCKWDEIDKITVDEILEYITKQDLS